MPKNKALPTSVPVSIEQAWEDGDEIALVSAVVHKYARVLDMTSSGRDIKPLVTGMFEAMDRLAALKGHDDESTPDSDIMRRAEEARQRFLASVG